MSYFLFYNPYTFAQHEENLRRNFPSHQIKFKVSFTKEELQIRIGKALREIRQLSGLSIESLAFMADMEYNQLSRIERGKVSTSVFCVEKGCKALKVSTSDFFLMVESGVVTSVFTKEEASLKSKVLQSETHVLKKENKNNLASSD